MAENTTAGAEAAIEGWEEALDVDDSDLHLNLPPSLPFPFLRPCNSHPLSSSPLPSQPQPQPSPPPAAAARRRIPGPAASVQAAMHRRSAASVSSSGDEEKARFAAAANDEEVDEDFQLKPWLCAVQFLGEEQAWERPGIGAISGRRSFHRAPQVVGVVKSCAPNGLGDLFLTLKDPTGTIGASVHQKVLSEGNLGTDISIGCVLVLKQVVVFCPSRSVCYLNVTLENVVKVLGRDCGPPSKLVVLSVTTKCQLPAKCIETGKGAEDQGHTNSARRAATETAERTREIFSGMISSNNKAGSAEVFPDGSGAATATRSSILRMDSSYGSEKHQEITLPEVAGDPHNKHISSNTARKQLQKIFSSMNAASSQPSREGSSAKSVSRAAADSAANEKMRGLFSGDWMTSCGKQATIAEVFPDGNGATPATSNNISRMDTDISYGLEKRQEIGLHEMAAGLHSKHASNKNTNINMQQNLNISNTSGTQPSLVGSSVKFGSRAATETTAKEKMRRLFDGDWIVSISKKPRIDEVLPGGNGGTTNISSSISGMNTGANYGLQKPLDIGLGDMAEDLHSKHISNKAANEHLRQNLVTADVDTLQPSLGGSSASVASAAAITGNEKNEPKKLIPIVSVAEWTDEQLSELFADY